MAKMVRPIRSIPDLGLALAIARKARGWTQSVLAGKAGLRQATISNIENGRAGVPIETLMNITSALELDLHFTPRGGGKGQSPKDILKAFR